MGQHSLTVFCAGVPLSFLTMVVLDHLDGIGVLIAVNVAGLASSMGVAVLATQVEKRKKTRSSLARFNPAV
jgi:hypothetical protein